MLDILTRAGCFVAIILIGYTFRRIGIFGPETFGVISKIVMKITLPAALPTGNSPDSGDSGFQPHRLHGAHFHR